MKELIAALREHCRTNRRNFPWRHTTDPYRILVSEVMLQQTRVERVVPYYEKFVRAYPSAKALARARFPEVLRAWRGLGYNRRAKYLHAAAKQITKHNFPRSVEDIEKLPGVGRYTARAVAAFAFNEPTVFVETNIRTVFLHHCCGSILQKTAISDRKILPLVKEVLRSSRMEPRDFYAALMDYGAHLKKSGVKLNAKSAHYAKQSKFNGSTRQLRGAILRELLRHHATLTTLSHAILRSRDDIARELGRLMHEGLVKLRGSHFSISD